MPSTLLTTFLLLLAFFLEQTRSQKASRILAGVPASGTTPNNKNLWVPILSYGDKLKLKGASMVHYKGKLIIFGGCRLDLSCSNTIFLFDFG